MSFKVHGEEIKKDLIADCKVWISKSREMSAHLQKLIQKEKTKEFKRGLH